MTGRPAPSAPRWLRRRLNLRTLTIAHVIVLLVLLTLIEWFAEHVLALGILLFAPPQCMGVPALILGVAALVRKRWGIFAVNAACAAVVLVVFMGARIRPAPRPQPGTLSVITHNIGQGNRAAFVDSFPDDSPDVVLLQDVPRAHRREQDYLRRYPGYRTRGLGPYMLLTPHEIEHASLVRDALWRGQPVAARFVIRWNGRSIAIYCVHMPTPRDSLYAAISPRVLMEMIGLRAAPTARFASHREWIDARVMLATQFAAVLDREELPFVVGGDFNTPDHGVIYHLMAKRLTDAHVAAGRGWGFTFPGGKESRLSALMGHWLRLDFLFAGRGWKPVDCRVANDDRSQHRAVLARFAVVP